MSDSPSNARSDDPRLDELIADYMQRIDRGETVDREQFLADHPEFAKDLRAFFETDEQVERLASPAFDSRPPTLDSSPTDRDAATLTPSSLAAGPPAPIDATPELDSVPQRLNTSTPQPSPTRLRYFGDYQLLEEIARGGMGVVYKARQVSLNRIVAVKMILAGELAGPDDVRRFRTEAEAAAQLQHPNIVAIHEVGEHEGQHYFSMDYVEGTSLAALVRENPLPAKQAAAIVKTVAEAIHYAHQKGILHRDLKPSNVLLQGSAFGVQGSVKSDESEATQARSASEGSPKTPFAGASGFSALNPEPRTLTPKVTDFGLAKRIEGGSELTGTGQILGTPSYMPPEQAGAKRGDIGPASDVYSLGAILYELLTGRPPFRAETPLDTLLQVLDSEPVAPRLLNPKLPRDLETICLKCLSKPPAQRYATAADLADDLRRYLAGEPIHARPVTSAERLWRLCRRNPLVATMTAAIAILLVGGTVISSYFAFRANTNAKRADEKAADAIREKGRADQKADEATANAEQERIQKDRADAKTKEARRHLYVAHMNLAQSAWEDSRAEKVLDLMDRQRPKPSEEDLRGFEWYYWSRLVHSYQMRLEGHTGYVMSVAFSADGKRLASASGDRTVKVWDATSGQEILTLKGHTGAVVSVAFSPDGLRLASVSWDPNNSIGPGEVKLWDAATGEELFTLKGHTSGVNSVAFSPDGHLLASGSNDETVKLWDATNGRDTLTLRGHTDQVLGVAFSPDGKRLASASRDQTVKLWDATIAQEPLTLEGHTLGVKSVVFSPDGKRLASRSYDRTVKVWDATSGQLKLSLNAQASIVAFSADGKLLASTDGTLSVKVWDATTGQETLAFKGHADGVGSVAISPDWKRLASGNRDGTVKVWDATSGQETLTLKGHTGAVRSVAFSRDGYRLASASYDHTTKVWDATSGQATLTLKGHTSQLWSVAFSADGNRLASACADGTVKLWEATGGQETLTFKGHTFQACGVAFSPDGKWLASASLDHTVKVWDSTTGQTTLTLKGRTGEVYGVAFSPDGSRLASASPDHTVKVWDATSGNEMLTLRGHTALVTNVAFSADGKRLASSDIDETVKLWDATSGHETLTLKGHSDRVTSVAFSADGKRLASASADGSVKVWDVTSGQETLTLKGHTGPVWCVVFSADGKRLASASDDGTVKVWDARPWTPELRAEQEALSLVRFYSTSPITNDQLLARIHADATVSEPVRQRALEFARQWRTGTP